MSVTTVGTGDVIAIAQRGTRPDADRLGSHVRMRQAVDEVLLPQLFDTGVKDADHGHVPVHLQLTFDGESGRRFHGNQNFVFEFLQDRLGLFKCN